MTKSMMVRLSLAVIALVGLTVFALQGWSTASTTAIESADRPVISGAAASDTDAPTANPGTNDEVSPVSDPAHSDAADPATASSTEDQDQAVDGESAVARQVPRQARGATSRELAARQSDDESVTMTLLHNNDGESKLLPDTESGFPGIARFAEAWVELGRTTEADILLRVSSGDNFLASKEFAAGLARDDEPLYDSIALSGLYEVMGLGNHDFDFGPDITARFIDGFRLNETSDPVTFVAANIDVSAEPALQALVDDGRLAPSSVFTDPTSGMSVGVIGALTPRLPNISSPRNVIVDPDVAAAVNAEAAALMDQGVNRIVLVSHLQGLAEDQALVPQLSGVDIVVAGGGDELLKNDGDTCQPDEPAFAAYPLQLEDADGNDVPVVTAPGGYRCIGRLDVTFNADGQISVVEGSSIGIELDGNAEEFAVARVEEPLTAALAELDATVVGQSDVALDGRRNNVRTGATNVGELLADAILAAGQQAPDFGGPAAVVAVQNGGGIRNDSLIPAGEITAARTFDIAPFANFVVAGEISREQFKEMLEVGVAGLPAAEGTFPQIAGFTMEVDASRPARIVDSDGDCSVIEGPGSRVRTVTLADGTQIVSEGAVVDGDDIALATIDFLANGGDCYPLGEADFVKLGASYQQALSSFIVDDLGGEISADLYPEIGTRTSVTGIEQDDGDDNETDETETDSDVGDDDSDAGDDDSAENDDADDEAEAGDTGADADDSSELPNTGADSWLVLIVALTTAVAGVLIFFEAERAGWLSLSNRIRATQAWIPNQTATPQDNAIHNTAINDTVTQNDGDPTDPA